MMGCTVLTFHLDGQRKFDAFVGDKSYCCFSFLSESSMPLSSMLDVPAAVSRTSIVCIPGSISKNKKSAQSSGPDSRQILPLLWCKQRNILQEYLLDHHLLLGEFILGFDGQSQIPRSRRNLQVANGNKSTKVKTIRANCVDDLINLPAVHVSMQN